MKVFKLKFEIESLSFAYSEYDRDLEIARILVQVANRIEMKGFNKPDILSFQNELIGSFSIVEEE
jgi:hypothetical protein